MPESASSTMQALRFYGKRDVRLDTVSIPSPTPNQVKVKVHFCGICGSDLHPYTVGPQLLGPMGSELPMTLGHEIAGEIVEIGSAVNGIRLKVGMKVAVEPVIVDGTCPTCTRGLRQCCDTLSFVGISKHGGGMSEYVCQDAKFVHPLPENIDTDIGALVEPLAVAWHATTVGRIEPGQSAMVLGAGPIGQAVLLCLLARGISTVVISEPTIERARQVQAIAEEHKGVTVVNPIKEDAVARAKELCGDSNVGPHVVFDCAGVQRTMDTAIDAVRKGGIVCNVAMWETLTSVDMNKIFIGEKQIVGAMCYSETDFQSVIDAISSGQIKPQKMITAKVPLSNGGPGGFEQLVEHRDRHVKILVYPN